MARLSVVTIFRNEEKHIASTVESLLAQTFLDFECIMIDGNSEDASIEVIQALVGTDSRFCIYPQVGRGISNAFNQGIQRAKSPHLLFLNGGDLLSNEESLSYLYSMAEANPNSIVSALSEYIAANGERTGKKYPPMPFKKENFYWYCAFSHQTTLVPMHFFHIYGGYAPTFQIAMDYELWLRALHYNYPMVFGADVLAYHREGGVSFRQITQARKELIAARLLHLPFWRASLLKDGVQLILVALKS